MARPHPTRQSPAGRAYLDLQNQARRAGRGTQELLTLYVVERWLARLSASSYADQFVLKGGMLLAAFDARRPTADADALARRLASDPPDVLERVVEIARWPVIDDGVVFDTRTATVRTIREQAQYPGLRVAMNATLATATVPFRLDVSFGDPVVPRAQRIEVPALRPGVDPVRVLGYPIETMLAEKIATAITLGAASTRVRDYADVYTLTGRHDLARARMNRALRATADYRGISLAPLSTVTGDLVELRAAAYTAYRAELGAAGNHLPKSFADVVGAVAAFVDPLIDSTSTATTWHSAARDWTR